MRVKEQRVQVAVAPLVGAWIERDVYDKKTDKYYVAPLVGAWIERLNNFYNLQKGNVAPLVGAWIES